MKLLITGAWHSSEEQLNNIKALGHSVVFMQNESDTLPCDCSEVEGVVCNGLFLHHPIESFDNLRYIQLTSAGFDRVDMRYGQERGITIHNARGVYSIPMAEFAISGVLALHDVFAKFCSFINLRTSWVSKSHYSSRFICCFSNCII